MSSEDMMKVCPSCKQKDYTSFSKCRNCGTRYDAIVEDSGSSGKMLDLKLGIVFLGAIGALGFFQWSANAVREARAKELAPLISEIKASNRPRVLEFYADWCGPCRNYGPAVESCKARYAGRVDVVRINVDSHNPLSRTFNVHAIPRTFTFDRQGNQIDEVAGDIGEERLDKLMQHLALLR